MSRSLVTAVDGSGIDALMLAADRGEPRTCAVLLAAGANASAAAPPPSGQTALMRAAAKGHAETIRLLLGHEGRSDPNARGGERLKGATALYLSAQSGHTQGVKALLAGGAHADAALEEMGVTPLFVAAERGHVLTAEALMLEGGADWQRTNWNGIDALCMAAIRGNLDVMESIRARAATAAAAAAAAAAARKDDGQGAAHERARVRVGKSQADPIKHALRRRANDGSTCLIKVVGGEEEEEENAADGRPLAATKRAATVRWLVWAGRHVHAKRKGDGATALLAAAANGVGRGGRGRGGVGGASKAQDRAEVVSALLHAPNPAGVLDAAMPDGRTALVLATSRGNVAMVKALLGAGATAGLSAALEVAVASREPDLIQLLSVSRDGERDM